MSRLTGSEILGLVEAYNDVYTSQELTEEQIWEEVETWVNSLLEEGYDLSEYTWEEMYEHYLNEAPLPAPGTTSGSVTMYNKPQPNTTQRTPLRSFRQTPGALPTDYKQQELRLSAQASGKSGLADIRGTQRPAPAKPVPGAAAKPAPTGQTVAAAGGKGGSVTVGRQYAATQGGVQGNVTYDAAGKKTFTAASGSASPKPPTAGAPSATSPTTPAKPTPMDQFAKANPGLAAKVNPDGTQKGTGQSKMARDAAELRDMQKASQMRQQGANVMGSNITSVRQDLEKANKPENLNKPAPAGTALAAQQQKQAAAKPTTTTSTAPTGGASLYGGATGVKPVGTPLTGGIKPVPNAPSPDAKFSVATPAPAAAAPKPATPASTPPKKPVVAAHYDLFDVVLGHLLDEGYADTKDAALAIMANMSEQWKQSIVEAGENIGKEPKTVGKPERPGVKGETYEEKRKRMKLPPA